MHAPILETRREHWASEADCAASAKRLSTALAGRDAVIELHGPLGAGKTSFARYLLRALGVQGRVKSPSYAVVESYEMPGQVLWHFDFYRFSDPQEWEDAGFRDIFAGPGLKLIEWPEHVAGLLPAPDLALHLAPEGTEESRQVLIEARTALGVSLL